MKRNLLFITYRDDDLDDGLSYALDLARMMDRGIDVLLLQKRKLSQKFESLMTAITFAEADDHKTAKHVMKVEGAGHVQDSLNDRIAEKCSGSGIPASITSALTDTASALGDFLKQKNNIDMVLLSPGITDNGNISSRELQKIVKTASRPIVTMAKQANAL